jgi:hypothetical protein
MEHRKPDWLLRVMVPFPFAVMALWVTFDLRLSQPLIFIIGRVCR